MHTREDVIDLESSMSQISNDFSQYDIEYRKVIWLVLKSLTNGPAKQAMLIWLDSQFGQKHKEYYQAFCAKISAHLTEEIRINLQELLESINSIVQLDTNQSRYHQQIESRIYEFLATNHILYTSLVDEINRSDSNLFALVEDYKHYLILTENENLVKVESYFDKMNDQVKEMLWRALRIPFEFGNRKMTDDWLTADAQNDIYNAVGEIDNQLKNLLKDNLDVYLEAICDTANKKLEDPEKKIFIFFASHMAVFNFISGELDKPNSVMQKILKEYKDFLNKPFRSLRAEYDKRRVIKLKDTKDEKAEDEKKIAVSQGNLRSLSLFSQANLPQNMINVRSVDFDMSLFNTSYRINFRSKNRDALVAANQIFIEHIIKEIRQAQYGEVIFMNGSLRQSFPADEFCCHLPNPEMRDEFFLSESYFKAITTLVQHVTLKSNVFCKINEYLLVDSFCGFKQGDAFLESTFKLNDINYESELVKAVCVDDKSKFILLYAQMHKIASENSNKMIKFDFYSSNVSELKDLFLFFINNRNLKPFNVILNLYHYDGTTLEKKFQVDEYQLSTIDYDYEENLKIILDCCTAQPEDKPMPVLSSVDDAVEQPRPASVLTSSNVHIPCSVSLNVIKKFVPSSFASKRVFTKSIEVARSVNQSSMSMAVSTR